MAPVRILSDEQFQQLTTDQKYLYINEMLRYVVASRPAAHTPHSVGLPLARAGHALAAHDYARLGDVQKIRYLENLIDELLTTVAEAQRTLKSLRTGVPAR